MIKIISKADIGGVYINIIKVIYKKPTANLILLNGQKLKIRNKTRVSAFTTLIQHSTGSSSQNDQTTKRNKRHPNWKGGSKTVIITDDMIEYRENRIVATKKLLDLISEFGKVADTKSIFRN